MNAKPFFIISLLANVGLGLVVVMLLVNRPARPPGGPEPATASQPTPAKEAAPARDSGMALTSTPALAPGQKPERKFDWRLVESADYKKYIANLRSIGCPEETIRDIIIADVNKLFESRRKELTAPTNKFEYWKSGNMFAGALDPAKMEKVQALNKEKADLLRELLGVVPEEKSNMLANLNPFETMLDFLPSEKQSAVMDVYMKYQTKIANAIGKGGMPDAEDMKVVQKMQKDMENELAGMLSAEDYRQYQMRMSQTAMVMRMQLASFEPSQDEFDKIFDAQKKFTDEFGMMGMGASTKEEREKLKVAEKEMKEQIKATLGAERFADYERSIDPNFQPLYKTAERHGLSRDIPVKVYDMKKTAEDARNNVRNDKNLTSEQRNAALLNIRLETEKSISTLMGEKAWGAYEGQAYWLDGIARKPEASAL